MRGRQFAILTPRLLCCRRHLRYGIVLKLLSFQALYEIQISNFDHFFYWSRQSSNPFLFLYHLAFCAIQQPALLSSFASATQCCHLSFIPKSEHVCPAYSWTGQFKISLFDKTRDNFTSSGTPSRLRLGLKRVPGNAS